MKKTVLMLLSIVLMCAQAMAQYSTGKLHANFPVRYMPKVYVPEGNRYFHVNFEASRQVAEYVEYGEVCGELQIGDGWREDSESRDVPVNIVVVAKDFLIEGIHEDEVHEKVRRHGEEHVEVCYVPHIDFTIILEYWFDVDGRRYNFTTNLDPYTHRPPMGTFRMDDKHFRNPHDCHVFVKENKEVFIEKIIRAEVFSLFPKMQEEMNNLFRYYRHFDNIKVCLFDNKKSPYYEKHRAAKEEIRRIIEGIPLEGPLTNTIKAMQPWIEHFKEIEASLSSADKKQKAAKADMIYNLAMIYFALEIYDVSREYAQKLYTEYGDGAGKRMIKWMDDVEADLRKHHLVSRHF